MSIWKAIIILAILFIIGVKVGIYLNENRVVEDADECRTEYYNAIEFRCYDNEHRAEEEE